MHCAARPALKIGEVAWLSDYFQTSEILNDGQNLYPTTFFFFAYQTYYLLKFEHWNQVTSKNKKKVIRKIKKKKKCLWGGKKYGLAPGCTVCLVFKQIFSKLSFYFVNNLSWGCAVSKTTLTDRQWSFLVFSSLCFSIFLLFRN